MDAARLRANAPSRSSRREFLARLAIAPLAMASASAVAAEIALEKNRRLAIERVEVWKLSTGSIFVLVRTNEGVTGIGECSPMNAGVIGSVLKEALVPRLIGRNPLDITRIWEDLLHGTYKLGVMGAQPEAISGIDIALWDILGKVTGLPVWQLLGGRRRDKIRLYSSIGGGARASVADMVGRAVDSVSRGFTALKLRMDWSSQSADVNPGKDWEIVRSVRKEVGDSIQLLYDANNGLSVSTAIRLGRRMQDELNLVHFEEPVAQHDYAGYAQVVAALDVPIAAGEHEYTLWQFRDLIERANVDILQPDVVKCAGLSEAIRIAHLASTHGKLLVPHQTQPTIGHTCNLHFTSCFDSAARAQEYNYSPTNADTLWRLFSNPTPPEKGFASVPDGAGLGLQLDEAELRKAGVLL